MGVISDFAAWTKGLKSARAKASAQAEETSWEKFPVRPPAIPKGIVPEGRTAPVLAMDSPSYAMAQDGYPGWGFPGFSYLSMLATRAEFRAFASAMSTEITREWIEFSSTGSKDGSGNRIKEIEGAFRDLRVREVVMRAAAQDCFFGRAQIFVDIAGADRSTPLILSPRTIKKGSLSRLAPRRSYMDHSLRLQRPRPGGARFLQAQPMVHARPGGPCHAATDGRYAGTARHP